LNASANLDALAAEASSLRRANLNAAIEDAMRRATKLLPRPDTTVCVLAADLRL